MATKSKSKKAEKQMTVIIDTTLDVPAEVEMFCKNIRVYVNAAVVSEAQEVFTELSRMRGIPVNIDQEVNAMTDEVAFKIYSNRDDLKLLDAEKAGTGAMQAIREARHYYRKEWQDATTDAMLLAVTMYTNIDSALKPKPYIDASKENFRVMSETAGMPRPAWLVDPLPPLPRRIENQYERRLKQIWDIMQMGGTEFAQNFFLQVNKAIAQLSNYAEEAEVDDGNFPPKSTD